MYKLLDTIFIYSTIAYIIITLSLLFGLLFKSIRYHIMMKKIEENNHESKAHF